MMSMRYVLLACNAALLAACVTVASSDATESEAPVVEVAQEQVVEVITEPNVQVVYHYEPPVQLITCVSEVEIDPVVVQQEAQVPEFGWDYEYVLRVVAAECRGEPYEGQLAVAQCIFNTAEARNMTPEEVVKEANQYASPVSLELVTESVRNACCDVFVMGNFLTDEPIRFFYSIRNGFVSKWHENNLAYAMTIGNHKFFKEKAND